MRRKIAVTLFMLILAAVCYGQTSYWYLNKPIKEIRFVGLENISEDELYGVIEPFIGKEFTNTLFLDLQSKILALRYFDQFRANALAGDDSQSSVIIEFTVKEVPIITAIEISGNKKVRSLDIMDVILLKEEDLMSKTMARMDAEEIENLYMTKGFPDVVVDWESVPDDETNTTTLKFTIVEGAQTRVTSILFDGISIVSENTLKRNLETKSSSIINTGVFQETNLELDKYNITLFYNERGYVDAQVLDITKEIISEEGSAKTDLQLTYYIDEGEQYTFGGIEVQGNSIFSLEEIKQEIRLSEGSILNLLKLQQDFESIKDLYFNDGYVANNFQFEEIRDEQNKSIVYKITIYEKPRSHVENIIIKGNEKTEDYVLYREIPLEIGDIFYKDKIFEGLQNLNNLTYFDAIDVETPLGSADGLLDLIITVEEGRTTDISFGATFSGKQDAFPLILFFKWSDLNFLGKGQEISVGTNLSADNQNIEFSFKENWLAGVRWYGGVSLSWDRNVETGIAQDREGPLDVGVPDPYYGYYVDENGNPIDPADLTDANVDDYLTDYEYYGGSIDDNYTMEYTGHDISLAVSTGYTHHTPITRLGIGTGLRSALNYINYDADIYRPFSENIRDNYRTWKFTNNWWISLSADSRDNYLNPTDGLIVKQTGSYTGGILGGKKDFISSVSAAEYFLTLFDIPVIENWNYKNILALHSSLSFIFPQRAYKLDESTGERSWRIVEPEEGMSSTDYLYIDGITTAKGWSSSNIGGTDTLDFTHLLSLWDSWIEIRMPILEDYIWTDVFFSGTAGWSDYNGIAEMTLPDFKFSTGVGIKSVIQILPIGLYLVKRFQFEDINGKYSADWQPGSVFPKLLGGFDFVISFNQSL